MKNLLTQWETEEENRKIGGGVPLISRKLVKLEDDVECASLPKLIKFVKKPFNLTKIEKKKLHCPISYFLACFVEFIERLCFCFVKNLKNLTDGLAMGGAELRRGEIIIGFFG